MAGVPDLTRYIDRIEERVRQGPHIDSAVAAMTESLANAARAHLGGDLTMSGTGQEAIIEPGRADGHQLTVRTGGVYALADTGRRRAVDAEAAPGEALATPFGPRRRVRGSTWPGFGITERHGRDALQEGIRAFMRDLQWFGR
jgi:hypothetical protein